MKKIVASLLASVMMLSCIGTLPILAADGETVLFEENFEAQTAGEKPAGMTCTENAEKQFLTRVVQTEDGGKALYVHHVADCACDSGGGPRASTPAFDISKAQTLKVSLRMKSANGAPKICLRNTMTSTEYVLWDGDPNEWTDVEATVNLSTMAFEVKANGSVANIGTFAEFGEAQEAQLRLYGVTKTVGAGTYYDDIKISTIGEREVAPPVNVEPKTTPTRAEIPQGAYVLINADMSDVAVGTAKSARIEGADGPEKLFTDASSYTEIVEIGGNRMLRLGAEDGKSHGPTVDFQLPNLARRFTMDYAVLPNTNTASLMLYSGDTRIAKSIGLINARTKNVNRQDWNYVHLEIDLENSVIKQSINGKAGSDIKFDPLTNFGAIRLEFLSSTADNMMTYVDNISIYTTDEVKMEGMLLGNEKIYWPNVKPEKPLSQSSYVNNLKQHPRILVNDWDEMRAKVNADYITKRWYEIIKAEAAQAFVSPPTEYTTNTRGNIIGPARAARNRLSSLAFCYKIEGKQEYLDMVWQEVLAYDRWIDWAGFNSSLCTAEIASGYAYVYDWLYDDLTAEQKAK
ncbi:MAG: hypothetical protein IJD83_07035, partial [Clostridia bacterium]|nr:hypothetical protein [Clostridia bacterium]